MTIVQPEQTAAAAGRGPWVDVPGLKQVAALVGRQVWPLLLGVLGLLGLLHVAFVVAPGWAPIMRSLSIDHLILLEQMDRSETTASDIAFLGDSSCLMGVYAPGLDAELRHAESFCTLAFVGPEGYAAMLRRMMAAGVAPKTLVLIFHPTSFRRLPSWEQWAHFVDYDDPLAASRGAQLMFPWTALDYLRFELVARLLYSPLPGHFGRYYGSEASFRADIASHQGSGVDPSMLRLRTLAEAAAITRLPVEAYDYSLNDTYRAALGHLAEMLREFGPDKVYLAVSPVPDFTFVAEQSNPARAAAMTEIAALLGLPAGHLLDTPGSYPAGYFSSQTHLNRIGRLGYTGDLSQALLAAGAAP